MTEPRFTPAEIGPTEDGQRLRIAWADGAVTEFVPRALRVACPCAGCVDEMTGARILDPTRVSETIMPLEIHYVGRYALTFVWSDGHSTGIYPFDYLRKLADRDVDPA